MISTDRGSQFERAVTRRAALDGAMARGRADADAGRTQPAEAVFDRLASRYSASAPTTA